TFLGYPTRSAYCADRVARTPRRQLSQRRHPAPAEKARARLAIAGARAARTRPRGRSAAAGSRRHRLALPFLQASAVGLRQHSGPELACARRTLPLLQDEDLLAIPARRAAHR